MLEMRIKSKQDVINSLQESISGIKRVVSKEVKCNDDLDAAIKSARAIFKTDGQLMIVLIAG